MLGLECVIRTVYLERILAIWSSAFRRLPLEWRDFDKLEHYEELLYTQGLSIFHLPERYFYNRDILFLALLATRGPVQSLPDPLTGADVHEMLPHVWRLQTGDWNWAFAPIFTTNASSYAMNQKKFCSYFIVIIFIKSPTCYWTTAYPFERSVLAIYFFMITSALTKQNLNLVSEASLLQTRGRAHGVQKLSPEDLATRLSLLHPADRLHLWSLW